jgi:hypothetical protein
LQLAVACRAGIIVGEDNISAVGAEESQHLTAGVAERFPRYIVGTTYRALKHLPHSVYALAITILRLFP